MPLPHLYLSPSLFFRPEISCSCFFQSKDKGKSSNTCVCHVALFGDKKETRHAGTHGFSSCLPTVCLPKDSLWNVLVSRLNVSPNYEDKLCSYVKTWRHQKIWRNVNTIHVRSPSTPLLISSCISVVLFSLQMCVHSCQMWSWCTQSCEPASQPTFISPAFPSH